MSKNHDEQDKLMMDTMYWWGIPTFFKCKFQEDIQNTDIAFVGVPHSTGNGTTERDQHLGPRAVRHVSGSLRRVHMKYGFSPWEDAKINDLGDVPLPEANNNEACIRDISKFYKNISDNLIKPVSIGGDHSVTGGILRGIAGKNSKLTNGKPVSLLHIDAHTDTFDNLDHFLGAKDSAAHWASFCVREGLINAETSIQVGLRGNTRTLDWLKPSYDLGYKVVTMEEFKKQGIEQVIKKIKSTLGDNPVYITFDLDCLDPTIAPAVSNLEPGCNGFSIDEAISLIQSVKGLNVIGGDIVCLMPTKDNPNNVTSMVAASVAFEIMSQIAWTNKFNKK